MLVNEQRLNDYINRDNKLKNKFADLEKSVTDLLLNHAGSPARAPVLQDADKPKDSYVFIKGNPGNHGPVVARRFITILSPGDTPKPFKEGSGRLELAQAIASKDNPLTARVMVNRIWLNHFGEGIVRTPDDFGTRGEAPSHPELLDYLASRFVADGWSVKKMHRLIMLSSVYQQVSDDNAQYAQIDPDNHWLWHMNRRRLDFEALRDTVLAIGGDLDLSMGGHWVKLDTEPYPLRRTIYGFVDRKNVPNMFQAFDFASPDLTTSKRETTVVPQQALFMMNNSLVVQQARNVVRRADFKAQSNGKERVKLLYNLIYQRDPTDLELKLALDYIESDAGTEWLTTPQSAWLYGYGQFDPAAHHTKLFVRMNNFADKAWHPGNKVPAPKLKGIKLTAEGGTPGPGFAVIRRWIAPRDGTITILGILEHGAKDGDGVQAHIVSSRTGELGSWTAFNGQTGTSLGKVAVKRGELIDFITEVRANPKTVAFKWAPAIRMEPSPNFPKDCVLDWNAQKDFSDTQNQRMGAWEKFAQVLLETNELTFVN